MSCHPHTQYTSIWHFINIKASISITRKQKYIDLDRWPYGLTIHNLLCLGNLDLTLGSNVSLAGDSINTTEILQAQIPPRTSKQQKNHVFG